MNGTEVWGSFIDDTRNIFIHCEITRNTKHLKHEANIFWYMLNCVYRILLSLLKFMNDITMILEHPKRSSSNYIANNMIIHVVRLLTHWALIGYVDYVTSKHWFMQLMYYRLFGTNILPNYN